MTALLAARGLNVSIAGIEVCRDLAIEINGGSCWAILGRNGCGKTTLMKTLAGLFLPRSGSITLDGTLLDEVPRRRLARTLGVLFQEQTAFFPATVLETALVGRHPYIEPWRWETAEDLALARTALGQVGLAGLENRLTSTLSGGEYQRLAIAALLAQQPTLYLLDEPSTHLDLYHQVHLLALFHAMVVQQKKAAVMVLHDVNLAARFCTHALLLYGDGAWLQGRAEDVLTEENLGRLFGLRMIKVHAGGTDLFIPE